MELTESVEKFINNNDRGILAIQSAIFIGDFKLIDGESQRVGLENCTCLSGGKELQLKKVTIQYKDIIAWGILK